MSDTDYKVGDRVHVPILMASGVIVSITPGHRFPITVQLDGYDGDGFPVEAQAWRLTPEVSDDTQ